MQKEPAKILKSAREKKGITQEEMAGKLGISLRQYHKYEAGDFPKYKKEVIKQIDEYLGTSLYALLNEHDVHEYSGDLSKIIGELHERLLRTEARLEVYESAIAETMSILSTLPDELRKTPAAGDYMRKVGELREEVDKAVNRHFDELGRKR